MDRGAWWATVHGVAKSRTRLKQLSSNSSSKSYDFSSSHVWMLELDYKESWALKNWCFWTELLEKTLESPLDCKEIQPVHSKGDQTWIFIGRNDVEAETPMLWPPDAKSWLIPWCWDNRGWDGWMASPTWWTWIWASSWSWWWTVKPGVLQSMDRKESDTTEQLNWTDQRLHIFRETLFSTSL